MKRITIFGDEIELLNIAKVDYSKLLKIKSHRNIVELRNYEISNDSYEVFTEYFPDGDLKTLVREDGRFKPRESLFLFYQILKGLQGLRDVDIVFKGLKTKNVMCFYKGGKLRLKIGDFGYNKPVGKLRKKAYGKELNLYIPPEVLDPETYQEDDISGSKEDVWSAGCIFYEILFGSHVFDALNKKQLLNLIKNAQTKLWTPPHIEVPPVYIRFIRQCLRANPSKRPTVSVLIDEVKKELERVAFQDLKNGKKITPKKSLRKQLSFSKANLLVEEEDPNYPFTLEA